MKTISSTLKFVTALIVVAFMFSGCGEETSVVQESSDIPTTLIVARNNDGSLLIKSDDGRIYDLDILEKFLDGELPGVKIELHHEFNQEIQTAPTIHPASDYMTDVSPWTNGQGVSIRLTWLGFRVGIFDNGARGLATFTITEYERISE